MLACVFAWFAATPPPAVQRRRPVHRDQVCNKTGHHARAFDALFENDELLRATFWDRKALKPTHVTYSLMLQARAATCPGVTAAKMSAAATEQAALLQRCNTVASGRHASRHHAAIDTMQHSDAHSACDARCAIHGMLQRSQGIGLTHVAGTVQRGTQYWVGLGGWSTTGGAGVGRLASAAT